MNNKEHCQVCNEGENAIISKTVKKLTSADSMPIRRHVQHRRKVCEISLPSRDVIIETVEVIRAALFPGYVGINDISAASATYYVGTAVDRARRLLSEQIKRGLCFTCSDDGPCRECEILALKLTDEFILALPELQKVLNSDVEAAFIGDPAAPSTDEIIFSYPGMLAITYYRIAHVLHTLKVPLLPRIITEYAHSVTGIDIHPGATIGHSFFIDHGTGVVIGETAEIGNNVRLYQGVTLGAKNFALDANGQPIKGVKRHPIVEDDVIIYAGATILGRVTIGKGAIIGGNVWLTKSVPPFTTIVQLNASGTKSINQYGDYVI